MPMCARRSSAVISSPARSIISALALKKGAELTNLSIRDRPLDFHEDDAVIVYSAWMALIARSVAPMLKSGTVAFFVQEFESVFHEYDSMAFLVNSAYRVPHVPIFNTRALH